MKSKLLTLLTVTMLTGSLFVGCGGNEAGADANNDGTDVSVNSEVNANDEVGVISDDDVSAKTDEMSEDTIRVFNAVREGVEKSNADRKANIEDYVGIVEATSPEGLELFGLAEITFEDEEASVENIVSLITFHNNGWCESYYIEFVNETDNYVDFNLYLK